MPLREKKNVTAESRQRLRAVVDPTKVNSKRQSIQPSSTAFQKWEVLQAIEIAPGDFKITFSKVE